MNCETCNVELTDDTKCTMCGDDATHCKNHHPGAEGGEAATE